MMFVFLKMDAVFGMKPFFFFIPEVWACSFLFWECWAKQVHRQRLQIFRFNFLHTMSLSTGCYFSYRFRFYTSFSLAVVLALFGFIRSSSQFLTVPLITSRPVTIVEVSFYSRMKQIQCVAYVTPQSWMSGNIIDDKMYFQFNVKQSAFAFVWKSECIQEESCAWTSTKVAATVSLKYIERWKSAMNFDLLSWDCHFGRYWESSCKIDGRSAEYLPGISLEGGGIASRLHLQMSTSSRLSAVALSSRVTLATVDWKCNQFCENNTTIFIVSESGVYWLKFARAHLT